MKKTKILFFFFLIHVRAGVKKSDFVESRTEITHQKAGLKNRRAVGSTNASINYSSDRDPKLGRLSVCCPTASCAYVCMVDVDLSDQADPHEARPYHF